MFAGSSCYVADGQSFCCSKYKVAKVERTRILIDQRWDAKPDAEAAQFIAPYKIRWIVLWGLLWVVLPTI